MSPKLCCPPHQITHEEKYTSLICDFRREGWKKGTPALKGYIFETYIQLVSGSHRWAAANYVGIDVPVDLHSYNDVYLIWGTDRWIGWIEDVVTT